MLVPSAVLADVPCRPAATVSGSEALVANVVEELVSRGIDVDPPATCPKVRVELTREDGEIVVDLIDVAARRVKRNVSRVGEAVTVIESWARPNMNSDLLAGFDVPASPGIPMPPAADAPTSPARPVPDAAARATTVVGRTEPRSPLTVSLIGDVGFDSRATWLGTMLTACTPLWWTCVGGTGHLRTATTVGLATDVAVLATIDVPVRVRAFTLMFGVGIGVGRDSDPMQSPPISTWSPRAEVRVVASYPLARWVFIDVAVGVVGASLTSDQQNQNQTGDSSSTSGLVPLFAAGVGLRLGTP